MENNQIKVLIADNTVEFGMTIAAFLHEKGIFAFTRGGTEDEIINAVRTELPDIVICSLTMNNSDALTFIRCCSACMPMLPKFIVISELNNSYIERMLLSSGVDSYISLPINYDLLYSTIVTFAAYFRRNVAEGNTDPEFAAAEIIRSLGIQSHLKGCLYLRSAVLRYSEYCISGGITKMLYPYIARKYATTPSRVERAIRHAIESAWERGDMKFRCKALGCTNIVQKPTNTEFIAAAADILYFRMKNDLKTQSAKPADNAVSV